MAGELYCLGHAAGCLDQAERYATEDVAAFPPTMVIVNECDPLRDEGLAFYRLLLRAGVKAQCRQVMGTAHGGDLAVSLHADISRTTARDLAGWHEECGLGR